MMNLRKLSGRVQKWRELDQDMSNAGL